MPKITVIAREPEQRASAIEKSLRSRPSRPTCPWIDDRCIQLSLDRQPPPEGVLERLSEKIPSLIEELEAELALEIDVVPTLALPDWHTLPLTQKIPHLTQYHATFGPFTKGKLCQKQNIPNYEHFNLGDPLGRSPEYNALRDPQAKGYLTQPGVKELLLRQGLINNREEVYMSLKELNDCRQATAVATRPHIHQILTSQERCLKGESQQLSKIRRQMKMEKEEMKRNAPVGDEGGNQVLITREERIFNTRMDAQMEFLRGAATIQDYKDRRTETAKTAKRKECEQRILKNVAESMKFNERRRKKLNNEKEHRDSLIASLVTKEVKVCESLARKRGELGNDKKEQKLLREMERNDKRLQAQEERRILNEIFKRAREEDIVKRKEKYDDMLEYDAKCEVRRKKNIERKMWLARKYFDIWRKKVREIVAKKEEATQDGQHSTTWTGRQTKNSLEDWSQQMKKICQVSLILCGKRCQT